MNKFRNFIKEKTLEEKFENILMEIGEERTLELLQKMNFKSIKVSPKGYKTFIEKKQQQNPTSYLIDSGYKIKSEEPTKRGMEIEFFKNNDAKNAKEDLESAGFGKIYSFNVVGKFLEYIEL